MGHVFVAGNLYRPTEIFRKTEARKHLGSKLRKSEKNVIFKKIALKESGDEG
jgi:hypothetical protein